MIKTTCDSYNLRVSFDCIRFRVFCLFTSDVGKIRFKQWSAIRCMHVFHNLLTFILYLIAHSFLFLGLFRCNVLGVCLSFNQWWTILFNSIMFILLFFIGIAIAKDGVSDEKLLTSWVDASLSAK
jgi:hypothetical protein